MDINKFFQSKYFTIVLWIIAAFVVSFFIFAAGIKVGLQKARFSYRWGENYHKNFGGPRGGFFRDFSNRDFIDANGVSGKIMNIAGATLVLKGRDDTEKIVLVNAETVIRRGKETVDSTAFALDDVVIVIGEPNDAGQIEAKFIRMMPLMPPPRMRR